MSQNESPEPKNKLETQPIGKLMMQLAIPSIIAQLVSILYNMVDRIFIGRIQDGTTAMAALSVSLPIITLITAVTRLIGIGGAPLCAIKMGQKKQDEAEEIMGTSFAALIAAGVLITAAVFIFHNQLLTMFGADSSTIAMASEYITIYSAGTVFVMIALGMNAYITTQGFANIGMCTVLIGAVLNIFLDALFINILGMGVKGAAIATVIGQGVSAVWALKFLLGRKSTLKIRRKYFKIRWAVLKPIMSLGVSPFTMSATEGLVQISFNNQLLAYGGTIAVSTIAIMFSLWQFITLPIQGICQGAQPIMSYNYGAGNTKRVRDTFKLNIKICILFTCAVSMMFLLFPRVFAQIFTSDEELLRMCSWALPLYVMGGTTFGAQICCQQSFMALGQAKISLVLACLRKIILLVPLIYIMPIAFGGFSFAEKLAENVAGLVGAPGYVAMIFMAESVSDVLAALCTSIAFYIFYKKNLNKGEC